MTQSITLDQESKLTEFLEPARIATVATVGKGGMPQLTPNWYWYSDGCIHISTTKERVKFRNVSRDPRIAVCIYSEPLAADYAVITGMAEILEGDDIWPITRSIIERYTRPDQVDVRLEQMRLQHRVILRLRPERVVFRR